MPRGIQDQSGADCVARARCAGAARGHRHANGPCRIEDGRGLLDGPWPGHGLRDHAVERGVGGVEGAGEVGCVEDASDAAPPELRGEFLDLGGERDGLWHDRV